MVCIVRLLNSGDGVVLGEVEQDFKISKLNNIIQCIIYPSLLRDAPGRGKKIDIDHNRAYDVWFVRSSQQKRCVSLVGNTVK